MASISLTLATWILAVLSSPPSPDTVDRVVDQPTPPVTSTRHRYRLRPLGIAGLIVAAEGLGTLVGASVLFARGSTLRVDGNDHEQLQFESHDHDGWVLFSVGTSALSVGALAFTIDVIRLRSRRLRSLSLTPGLDRSRAGVVLSARF